jgi:methionyl aminopeptidase
MIVYKTEEEIELIRESCLLVCKALSHVASLLEPGVTGKKLDTEAETLIRDHGAEPGFKGYRDFPSTLCISKNEEVVHGIPDDYQFQEGDIASIDCGVYMNGYYGDAAYTFAFNDLDTETLKLLQITKASLYKGIENAVAGKRLGDIGFAIQDYTEKMHGYGVVRELVGHGVGKNLHESPEVPNYGKRGRGIKLQEGLVIAIEPMINLGTRKVRQSKDGWTVYTKDKKPSAHYEHTVAVRKEMADILSDHSNIEGEIEKNEYLTEILI